MITIIFLVVYIIQTLFFAYMFLKVSNENLKNIMARLMLLGVISAISPLLTLLNVPIDYQIKNVMFLIVKTGILFSIVNDIRHLHKFINT